MFLNAFMPLIKYIKVVNLNIITIYDSTLNLKDILQSNCKIEM